MCVAMNRVVPPPSSLSHPVHEYTKTAREHVPEGWAQVQDILDDRCDAWNEAHSTNYLIASECRVPPLIVYVAGIQCHEHSDCTASVVDETNTLVSDIGNPENDKSVTC